MLHLKSNVYKNINVGRFIFIWWPNYICETILCAFIDNETDPY